MLKLSIVRILISVVLVAALLLFYWRPLITLVIRNAAQLTALHDNDNVLMLKKALQFQPNNRHIIWQWSMALAKRGDYFAAYDAFNSLLAEPNLPLVMIYDALRIAVYAEQPDQALKLYQQANYLLPITAFEASMMANYLLEQNDFEDLELLQTLLCHAIHIAYDSPICNEIVANLTDTRANENDLAKAAAETLRWRRAPPPNHTTSGHTATDLSSISLATHVAKVLNLHPDHVTLGDELLVNGSFEKVLPLTYLPTGWREGQWVGGKLRDPGAFIVGTDIITSTDNFTLRIDGLYIERTGTNEPARAGVIHDQVTLKTGALYLLSLLYRTAPGHDPQVRIYLNDRVSVFAGEQILPPTNGTWSKCLLLAWNRNNSDLPIHLHLRIFATGTAWFDNVSLREVQLYRSPDPTEPILQVLSSLY